MFVIVEIVILSFHIHAERIGNCRGRVAKSFERMLQLLEWTFSVCERIQKSFKFFQMDRQTVRMEALGEFGGILTQRIFSFRASDMPFPIVQGEVS